VYALEAEPEEKGRYKRLGTGAAIAAIAIVVLGYGAQRFEPTRRLIQRVVQMSVLPDPQKKQPDLPPRTEPPPPPPKRPPPKSAAKPVAQKSAPQPPNPDAPAPESVVGLDDGSFGESGSGPGFQVGNTLMGDPTTVAQPAPAPAPPAPPGPAPKQVAARMLTKEPPGSLEYTTHARKLGIEGLIVVELELDETGKVVRVRLRKKLEDSLDSRVLDALKEAAFSPATLAGRAVPSTIFWRTRFDLEH
jgi:periplasmic protein TonB